MSNPATVGRPRRFPWLRYLLGFIAVFLVMAAPVIIAVTSSDFAAAHGCKVDEGSVHPCIIGGTDYGELFYSLGVMGWLILVTGPLGFICGIVLFIVMLVHYFGTRRVRQEAQ